jgi:hypothetical protein
MKAVGAIAVREAAGEAPRASCAPMATPVPLLRLLDLVSRHRSDGIEAFLRVVIKEWTVLWHFTVLASRSGNGKNRFRFVIGDFGLERYDPANELPSPRWPPTSWTMR